MNDTRQLVPFHRAASCEGETCTLCGQPAAMKVGEEIMHDDPHPNRHNFTAYVCLECGNRLFFPSLRPAPEYEYRTTEGPRKAWDGEPDLTEGGWELDKSRGRGGWERLDAHEEMYWRRKLPAASREPTNGASEVQHG